MGVAAQSATHNEWTAAPTRNFPLPGGNYWHQRYSALDRISTATVKKLGGAWSIHLDEGGPSGPYQATPIVLDGVMYVTTGTRQALAIEAATGKVKWRYRPDAPGRTGGNMGVAVADGRVYFGRRDNVLVALDQQTGRLIWQTQVTPDRGAHISAPTIYWDGMVYVGTSGGDSGSRGQVVAYEAATGKEAWRFFTIPGPGDRFVDTWEGESYRNGGGGVWVSPTLDPELGMIYVSVGNVGLRQYGAADNNPAFKDEAERPGDNLFTACILALDLKNGAYRWHFQQVHHDVWHLDAGGQSVLADILYHGKPRKILINAGKTGYLYILDRTNGTPLIGIEERPVRQSAELRTARTQPYPIGDPFVPVCAEPLGDYERGCLFSVYGRKPVLVGPGTAGGNTWAPTAFSPKTGLVYVPGTVFDSIFQLGAEGPGRQMQSTTIHPPGTRRSGTLTAMDPTTNRIVWQRKTKYMMGGGSGLLATAGGLLFHGQSDGNLVAFDMKNGDELWRFQTGAGADAPVATYEVNGEQYVAVLAGGNAVNRSPRGDALWAFKLGGTVPPAPTPREPPTIEPEIGR
jgi:alcohol dehydrogenase (cytochrome c)